MCKSTGMKRLWKIVPPCMADTLGFEAVMNKTEGLGVIDDCSGYKPLDKMPWRSGERPGWQKEGNLHQGGNRSHGGGGRGGRPRMFPDVRIVHSDIHEEDVIHGTEQKMLRAFASGVENYKPNFVILSTSPVSSMISTDLDSIAHQITKESGLPTANVYLDGQRDYLYGISQTLEAMGKLLIKPMEKQPNTLNLLGCNSIDWSKQAIDEVESWLANSGICVRSRWGIREQTENLQLAASASVNLVVNISGLRLARWMESEFNIPYITAAPLGSVQCNHIISCIQGQCAFEPPQNIGEPEALVIGEQLEVEAIRTCLLELGFRSIRVCSLYEMDKSIMQEGDCKLTGEDDLKTQLNLSGLRMVVSDPDYRLLSCSDITWVTLPNNASQAPIQKTLKPSLIGDGLDTWIRKELRMEGAK